MVQSHDYREKERRDNDNGNVCIKFSRNSFFYVFYKVRNEMYVIFSRVSTVQKMPPNETALENRTNEGSGPIEGMKPSTRLIFYVNGKSH